MTGVKVTEITAATGGLGRGLVVVSGASTGIGAALAHRLDALGYAVLAGVRNDAAAAALMAEAKAASRLRPVRLDVTRAADLDAVAALVAEIAGEAGLLGLVNNAGIAITGPVEALPLAEVRRQFEINVFGAIGLTQALLPHLRRASGHGQGRGRIVNMSSVAGRVVPPFAGIYSASKHALEAVSDALRVEVGPFGVHVALVEPGPIATPLWAKVQAGETGAGPRLPTVTLYERPLAAFRAEVERAQRGALPAEAVVECCLHALTAARPRPRYPVGWMVRVQILLARLAPDRWRDAFFHYQLPAE